MTKEAKNILKLIAVGIAIERIWSWIKDARETNKWVKARDELKEEFETFPGWFSKTPFEDEAVYEADFKVIEE